MPGRDTRPEIGDAVDYPKRRDDADFLGVRSPGIPVYYDSSGSRTLELDTEALPDGRLDEWNAENTVPDGWTPSDVVEDIEERFGWDSLSEYANEHVPGIGDDGNGSGDRGEDGGRSDGGGGEP